jgi:anti-anti-sigma factor
MPPKPEPRTEIHVIESNDPVTHVALAGRLDSEGVDAIAIAFSGHTVARRRPTIVDLREVEFLASLAMGMIVRAARALKLHQAGMVLLAPREPVERALRSAQIDMITPIARDRDEALRMLEV